MDRKKRDGDKERLAKYVLGLSTGFELDKLMTTLVFERKIGECAIAESGWHIRGAVHYQSLVKGEDFCGYELPNFSTDWEHTQVILEWLTSCYPSVQIFWDCDYWSCNINAQDEIGNWYRLTAMPGAPGFQEALCKASLLSKIHPRDLPLEIKFVVTDKPKKSRKRRKKKS